MGAVVIDGQVAAERATQAERAVDQPVPGSPEWLISRHDCWTDTAPADVEIPGHVVVTTRSGITRYAGERMVGLALEQIFDGADQGLIVHAFCR